MDYKKSKQGFTLLELMISIFIFSVVTVVVAGIFLRGVASYQYANSMQKGLEEAQFAMSQIAKVLRTSSVISSTATTITVFDNSQTKCIRYVITSGMITQQIGNVVNLNPNNWCGGVSYGAVIPMTTTDNGTITGVFDVISSVYAPPKVGKVSMVFLINVPNSNNSVRIQSSVSLRDYTASGLL